jgi:hypothetical protein
MEKSVNNLMRTRLSYKSIQRKTFVDVIDIYRISYVKWIMGYMGEVHLWSYGVKTTLRINMTENRNCL